MSDLLQPELSSKECLAPGDIVFIRNDQLKHCLVCLPPFQVTADGISRHENTNDRTPMLVLKEPIVQKRLHGKRKEPVVDRWLYVLVNERAEMLSLSHYPWVDWNCILKSRHHASEHRSPDFKQA
jgi:hypothetical protein